jgi:hypothetical protein
MHDVYINYIVGAQSPFLLLTLKEIIFDRKIVRKYPGKKKRF